MAPTTVERRGKLAHGVPTRHARTEAGAKAAAANYTVVAGTSAFLTDRDTRHRALSVMTARESRAGATKQADHAVEQASTDLDTDRTGLKKSQTVAGTGVLSAATLGFDIHKATIRLWTTTVRGTPQGSVPPRADFHSVTVSLIWESNDWKLERTSSTRGLVAPIDVRQTTSAAADFSNYADSTAINPVFSGATADSGFPSAYGRDERGAHAAATSAAMLHGDARVFADADWRHRMLEATAAPDVLDTVTADADSTADLVVENRALGEDGRTADGGLLVTRTAVLGTRSISVSDQAASVELWTASIGGVAGNDETERPQIGFLRMTVDLTWADGTWKTTAVTPGEPLVPSFALTVPASPANSFVAVGGEKHAPALA
ncbi:hypothetical protein FF041_34530 [Streptomyces jumonjinensis]|uniref:Uncharacterized protein n=1 Tax=Streptomyces jumonjinensis TaxID=1945 RepID=A0A646KSK9_STRJU|nr:hypothetical protein [Streptomyces jumonjinensis]